MKVALYLGNVRASQGGGFTFQDEITQALLESPAKNRHSFVIYGSPASRYPDPGCGQVEWVPASAWDWGLPGRWLRVCFEPLSFVGDSLQFRSRLQRSLRRHQAEAVWFVSPEFQPVELPYVYTVWDLQHRIQPWFPEVSAHGRWHFRETRYRQALSRAAAVIVPNAAGREELIQCYGILPERIKILPHPTPSFALQAAPAGSCATLEKYGLMPGYLFYPAQFWPHKNHANLLLALKELRERDGILLPLVLTGSDQGNRDYVESLIEHWQLSGQVRILGFVGRQELIELYRHALALSFVSFFGPENLPPLEAQALGCPVIAAKVRGAQEQLGEGALWVDPASVQAIAAALKAVYERPDLRQDLIRRGRERASRWTAGQYVQQVLEWFDAFEPIRRCWPAAGSVVTAAPATALSAKAKGEYYPAPGAELHRERT